MTSEVDLLLTDEFVAFSGKIKEIHEQKKAKEVELKEIYERFKSELASLDQSAIKLNQGWEKWVAKQTGKESSE